MDTYRCHWWQEAVRRPTSCQEAARLARRLRTYAQEMWCSEARGAEWLVTLQEA